MKKLLMDMEKLAKLDPAGIKCEYLYHAGKNLGVLSLIEIAEFSVYCRQCKDAHCVKACPRDALERQIDGSIKRYNLRCVGCRSCALACPFGTIFPETMSYVADHCDFCLRQIESNPGYVPQCVKSCPDSSLELVDLQTPVTEENLFFVGKHLVVKVPNWRFKEGRMI